MRIFSRKLISTCSRKRDPGGFFVTVIIGIVGAMVGGLIGTQLGFGGISGFDFRSFLIAIVGAMLLLLGYRVVKRAS
jgi:uncharacterized membrane protein YeaQ/YmgE (transglycosylase-associated protein family)